MRWLKSENHMLTVDEFIVETKFPINKIYYSMFWRTLNEHKWIHLSDNIINLIGFEGEHKVPNCYRLLRKSFILGKDYKELSQKHIDLADLKRSARSHGGSNKKYTLVEPQSFKKFILKANTKLSDKVHDYYISIEELLKQYIAYVEK